MAGSMQWHGEEAQRRIGSEMTRRIEACCRLVVNRAKQLLSVSGTGTGKKRRYGSAPSAPGDPPRKQFGHLRRSVTSEVVKLEGRVGTNLLYGMWLELGTRLMQARPWLRRALRDCRDAIRAILSAPMKWL